MNKRMAAARRHIRHLTIKHPQRQGVGMLILQAADNLAAYEKELTWILLLLDTTDFDRNELSRVEALKNRLINERGPGWPPQDPESMPVLSGRAS